MSDPGELVKVQKNNPVGMLISSESENYLKFIYLIMSIMNQMLKNVKK